jgi:rSAM/selenodomain-associated transferase 1
MRVGVVVLAKVPRPGRSKTRLQPPCTPAEAAELASAALLDTVVAIEAASIDGHRVLALDVPVPWLTRPGWRTIAQRGDGLDERLASAFNDVGGPAVLVGMDTPQVTAALLEDAVARLRLPNVDAVLGEALDGGYWAIGLRRPNPAVFLGVPMSEPTTAIETRARLRAAGLRVVDLPKLRDVDTIDDACAVAGDASLVRRPGGSRFAATLWAMGPRLVVRRAADDLAGAGVSP